MHVDAHGLHLAALFRRDGAGRPAGRPYTSRKAGGTTFFAGCTSYEEEAGVLESRPESEHPRGWAGANAPGAAANAIAGGVGRYPRKTRSAAGCTKWPWRSHAR